MGLYTGPGASLTELIWFFAFTPADDREAVAVGQAAMPVVEARFNDRNNSPAVVSRRFGDGRVVMVYTSASQAWNDWASLIIDTGEGGKMSPYVTFVSDMVDRLARVQRSGYNLPAGSEIVYELPQPYREASIMLQPPGKGADLVSLALPENTPPGRPVTVKYPQARQVGVYRLRLDAPSQPQREVLFARYPDSREGQLGPAGKQQITAALGSGEYEYVRRSATGEEGEQRPAGEKKEYWVWAALALLGLLALETFLAQRFGHWK
jgi:hypothetical protein